MSTPNFRFFRHLLALLLCFVLTACAGTATTSPLPDTPQMRVETVTPESSTPTLTAVPRPSHTPAPTNSVIAPQYNYEATFPTIFPKRFTETAIARTTESAQGFDDSPIKTKLAGFSGVCKNSWPLWYKNFSPNENWLATPCGSTWDQTLEIVNREGKRWVLYFKDYLPEEEVKDGGVPIGNLHPAHWSNDGQYLYFAPKIEYDGGGTCLYRFGMQGLYRLNLNDGRVSATLPIPSHYLGYHIAFSPTGRRLAFQEFDGPPAILDLYNGDITPIEEHDRSVGSLKWSPDGLELAYATCLISKEDRDAIAKSAIKIYSVQEHTLRTILEMEHNLLSIEFWGKDNVLTIGKRYDQTFDESVLLFDLSSGQVIITPTPTP